MRELLRGWKRKAGCVVLLFACISTAIWNVSCICGFGKTIMLRSGTEIGLSAGDGKIWFIWSPANGEELILISPCWAPVLTFYLFAFYLLLWPQRRAK